MGPMNGQNALRRAKPNERSLHEIARIVIEVLKDHVCGPQLQCENGAVHQRRGTEVVRFRNGLRKDHATADRLKKFKPRRASSSSARHRKKPVFRTEKRRNPRTRQQALDNGVLSWV